MNIKGKVKGLRVAEKATEVIVTLRLDAGIAVIETVDFLMSANEAKAYTLGSSVLLHLEPVS